MPDDFNTLSQRLLNRAPAIGIVLAQQFVNDAWRTLQSRRQWSWRRRSGCFAPPDQYSTGTASTNVAAGNLNLITGVGTTWTAQMIGLQIRLGGYNNPFYTIVAVLGPTSLLIDQQWFGPDLTNTNYQIIGMYYTVPADWGAWYSIYSPRDGFRLWTNVTEDELNALDPQRTTVGQTYSVVYKDYTSQFGGLIGPVIPVAASGATPISTTTNGYSYIANTTYIVKITVTGPPGDAQFNWMQAGQVAFQPSNIVTDANFAQDLNNGVQVYWPAGTYTSGDLFVINCQSLVSAGVPRFELWPTPSTSDYLYPYIYIAKEYDLTAQAPQLPPFVANRGEILLEMALEKSAMSPMDGKNPYFNLTLAKGHAAQAQQWIWDLETNDEEVGVTNISYQPYPMFPSPWSTGQWQQTHAPFFG